VAEASVGAAGVIDLHDGDLPLGDAPPALDPRAPFLVDVDQDVRAGRDVDPDFLVVHESSTPANFTISLPSAEIVNLGCPLTADWNPRWCTAMQRSVRCG
jgi:hypothetical protein